MYSHIRQHTPKFSAHYLMEQFVKKACKNTKNLFYKNISKAIFMVNRTIPGTMKILPYCDATVISNYKFLNRNIFQNTFGRLKDTMKVTARKYFWNRAVTKININHSSIQSSMKQHYTVTPRLHGFCGLKESHLFTSSKVQHRTPTLARSFATSSVYSQNQFAARYDFPILPILTASKTVQPKKISQPIAQKYMPTKPLTYTRTASEKVYRKIRNSCKSLVTDLMYSFPFNTHSDVDRTKQLPKPNLNIGEANKNPINLIIDKLSPTPRQSIWSITDKFSFPIIDRRFDIETFVKQKEDDTEDISTADSSIIADI